MKSSTVVALLGAAGPALAISGSATTTHYYDGTEGACGCGSSSGGFSWQNGLGGSVYTAAGSQALFDGSNKSWCGAGCGTCYKLTSTGSAPSGQGTGGTAGQSITVMVTNLCPNAGNAQWCPTVGGTNQYGYSYHFDIMASGAGPLGDNPIVNFEEVDCPSAATTDYSQCVCAKGSG